MIVNISALILKKDLKLLTTFFLEMQEKLESLIEPLDNPLNIFNTTEHNELLFNHFPVECDLFGGSQNFYYNFYNLKFFITNGTAILKAGVEFESISFDPITLIAVSKFKLLVIK